MEVISTNSTSKYVVLSYALIWNILYQLLNDNSSISFFNGFISFLLIFQISGILYLRTKGEARLTVPYVILLVFITIIVVYLELPNIEVNEINKQNVLMIISTAIFNIISFSTPTRYSIIINSDESEISIESKLSHAFISYHRNLTIKSGDELSIETKFLNTYLKVNNKRIIIGDDNFIQNPVIFDRFVSNLKNAELLLENVSLNLTDNVVLIEELPVSFDNIQESKSGLNSLENYSDSNGLISKRNISYAKIFRRFLPVIIVFLLSLVMGVFTIRSNHLFSTSNFDKIILIILLLMLISFSNQTLNFLIQESGSIYFYTNNNLRYLYYKLWKMKRLVPIPNSFNPYLVEENSILYLAFNENNVIHKVKIKTLNSAIPVGID